MAVILGDRTEMLGVAFAAINEGIPIAHIHGGEVTEGAVDDCVRHSITKMSYLHFTTTDIYRRRVIQMGEDPGRVYNVGALSTETILTQKLPDENEIRSELGIPSGREYAVVTFHPVTMEKNTIEQQINELCKVMCNMKAFYFIITGSNADAGGDKANELLQEFAGENENVFFSYNLGMRRYLGAVKNASFVLGNSSSGLIEAPVLGTPTVNIGDRQKGRLLAETVLSCSPEKEDICCAINKALIMEHKPSYLYGDGNTSEKIVKIIKETFDKGIKLKKAFYDIPVNI